MVQKVIQVGNSLAITIPKRFVDEVGLKVGQVLDVEHDKVHKSLQVALPQTEILNSELNPEFVEWLNKFNAKYKYVLTELSKK